MSNTILMLVTQLHKLLYISPHCDTNNNVLTMCATVNIRAWLFLYIVHIPYHFLINIEHPPLSDGLLLILAEALEGGGQL